MATSDHTIQIPLTKGFTALIDDTDGDLVQYVWRTHIGGRNTYAVQRGRNGVAMHRLILSRMLGRELSRKEHVDHINGNACDNRRCNLRLASCQQNTHNQQLSVANKSGYKGASWDAHSQKWRAQIKVDGRVRTLGRFDTPEEAHEAYCKAAKEHFGEFARFE